MKFHDAPLELLPPWRPVDDLEFAPTIRIFENGRVRLLGSVVGGEDGDPIAHLPEDLRPYVMCDETHEWGRFQVATDGYVRVWAA